MALYFATYGQGQGPITLDEVDCRGDEGLLLNCSHLPIGSHNCGHYEDASVYCYGNLCVCIVFKRGIIYYFLSNSIFSGATRMISPSASSGLTIATAP